MDSFNLSAFVVQQLFRTVKMFFLQFLQKVRSLYNVSNMKQFFMRSFSFVNVACLALGACVLSSLQSCSVLSKAPVSKSREISSVSKNSKSIQAKQKKLYDLTEKDADSIQNIKDILNQHGVRTGKTGGKTGKGKRKVKAKPGCVVLDPHAVLALQKQFRQLEQSKKASNKLQNEARRNCDELNNTALALRSIEHGEALERKRHKKGMLETAKELVTGLCYLTVLCIIGLVVFKIFKVWKK